MSTNQFDMSLTEISALFKIKYEKLSENVYNSSNVLLGRCKKSYNFVGEKMVIAIPQSFAGGVGSGSLPKANKAKYGKAEITAKKLYARVQVDRETIKAASKDEGSFVRATKEVVKKGVESYMRNLSRILFSDSDQSGGGALAKGDNTTDVSGVGSTADPFIVSLEEASFKEANLEEQDLVNIEGETTNLEIIAVDASSTVKTISLVGTSAELAAKADVANNGTAQHSPSPTSKKIFMQGSEDKDPTGLGEALKSAASGSLYSINRDRKWSSTEVAASSASISTDLLNKVMLQVEKKCGKAPNLLVCSYEQYEKILNILEDQKRYEVKTRAGLKSKSGADISFSGIEFMSTSGPVGIFPDRFADKDTVYALNDNQIHIHHRPDFGWFDDDGTVFMRLADEDAYEARYGGYLEIYVNPAFHGRITGLAV